jgi:hypothetical protein
MACQFPPDHQQLIGEPVAFGSDATEDDARPYKHNSAQKKAAPSISQRRGGLAFDVV